MPEIPSPILVFGPAYLDRIVRVDRPLVDPSFGDRPLDGSVDGSWTEPGEGLSLIDPSGNQIRVQLPDDWPGPSGTIRLSRDLSRSASGWSRMVRSSAWQDDLGGMGAGFAAALEGELISALGSEDDPASRTIAGLLAGVGITHRPIRVEGTSADWTLLVTSGEHGDKLPIGFRGCHASLRDLGGWSSRESRLRVVASLPNRLAAEALRGPASIRMFAPASRNMLDRDPPISAFAEWVDVLCCNRGEWEILSDREEVAWRVSILVVTDGPNGAVVRFTDPSGEADRVEVPAFPRARPPLDTNRAGEAFASELISTLLDAGWTPGVTSSDLARNAAERASVASALVLDRGDFGFPTGREVDQALHAGRVG
ncbi:carbohydrate kinase family protein [Tundrisphaera lichenicola]|uniref:carbohydrate kinase family protein n=1 Tax=Tundrisphaera lichenicola TaxID=2029860 RepID=UPI003EB9BD41